VTNESRQSQIPFERRHVATGKPRGAKLGNQNAYRHGLRSKSYLDQRRAFMQLLRACRAAARSAEGAKRLFPLDP
jgi:hypothetical protein